MPSLRWSAPDAFRPEEGSREHLRVVHGLGDHVLGLRYTIGDTEHFIHQDEIDAIERSGRSSWQEYASTPTEYPAPVHGAWKFLNLRPGATEPIQGQEAIENNFQHWTYYDDRMLMLMHEDGAGPGLIGLKLQRSVSAVEMRMRRLGLKGMMQR